MSIHSSHSANSIAHGMHGTISGIGQAAISAWMLNRQNDQARRVENEAACATAASRARAAVMLQSDGDLRERLADAHADNEVLSYTNSLLRKQVADLERRCRILAEAVTEAGLVD